MDVFASRMDSVMISRIRFVFCCSLFISHQLNALSIFGSSALTSEQKIEKLQRQQIDAPLDPEINYNLGVALYHVGRFDEATTHFARTLAQTQKDKKLIPQALFNKANASLKHTLSILPPRWEQQENIEPQLLDNALAHVATALEDYQSFLTLQTENLKAQTNKKYAEKLKEKLEKKKQKQQNKNKQQQDQNKQQQDQQKQEPQNQSEKNQQDKQNQPNDQKNQDRENRQQGQEKQQQQQQKEQQHKDQSKSEQNQQSTTQGTHGNEEKQAQQQKDVQQAQQHETPEDRRMRALLENLQSDESQQQKALMQRQVTAQQPQPERGQKPW
jgi:Ca-activated chloride channel homolog